MAGEADAADPTELAGVAEMGTESVEAWSVGEVEDYPLTGSWEDPERRWTPRRVTILAAAASVAVVGSAVAAVVWQLQRDPPVYTTRLTITTETAVVTTVVAAPAPPPTVTVRAAPSTVVKTVQPQPIDYDPVFIGRMIANDWVVYDSTLLVKRAHLVCDMLRRGYSADDVSAGLTQAEPVLTLSMTRQFVAVAMATYPRCP